MQEDQRGRGEMVVMDHNCYSYFGVDDNDQSSLWRTKTFAEAQVPPPSHADTCDVRFFTLLIRNQKLSWVVFILLILTSLLKTVACQPLFVFFPSVLLPVSLLSILSKSLLLHTLGLVHFLLFLFHFFLFISYLLLNPPPILPHSCTHTLYQSFLSFSTVMLK